MVYGNSFHYCLLLKELVPIKFKRKSSSQFEAELDGIPVYRGTLDIIVGMVDEKISLPTAIEKAQGMQS